MKLELKHLAPYLPYGLKLFYTHTEKIGQISNIYTIGEGYDNDDIKLSIDYTDGEHIWMFKPILKPLSDLKKISQDEYERMYEVYGIVPSHLWLTKYMIKASWLNHYDLITFLISKHYDVFGLIEAGLAIDINTLNK